MRWPRVRAAILLVLTTSGHAFAQRDTRRPTTVTAVHQYPGYYHLQNVLLHGEVVESGARVVLRGGERDIALLLHGQRAGTGLLEVRGQLIDVGRLDAADPRLAAYDGPKVPQPWPRPGEELVLSVTAVAPAQLATSPSVRALALQPWRFEGQKVAVIGQFRGRNLFGDLPSAPGKSPYDFVLRSADAAVWITGLRPRGRGFDLSVDARVDTGQWLQVSGTVVFDRGLVTVVGASVATAMAPEAVPVEEETPPAVPLETADVIFSSPTEGDVDVPPTGSVRLQFSRGLNPASIAGQIRVTYVGAAAPDAAPTEPLEFVHTYDLGTRAIELKFARPLERFRTIKVELLDGAKAFDGASVAPLTLTFSTGG